MVYYIIVMIFAILAITLIASMCSIVYHIIKDIKDKQVENCITEIVFLLLHVAVFVLCIFVLSKCACPPSIVL